MTRKKQQTAQTVMPGTERPTLPPNSHVAVPPSLRQLAYRERVADKNARNAEIANLAMGLVNMARTMEDLGCHIEGIHPGASEVDILIGLRGTLSKLADPFCDAASVITWRNATITPSKGTAKPRRQRERVGT